MSTLNITYRPGADEMAPETKLPKPYKFQMTIAETQRLIADYNHLCTAYAYLGKRMFTQYPPRPRTKPVKYGIRLDCWLLALKLEDFGPDRGCTKEEWQKLVDALRAFFAERLPGSKPYSEDWSHRKPQFSFETYIRYSEHS